MDEDTEEDFRMSFQPSSFAPHGGMTFSSHSVPTNQHNHNNYHPSSPQHQQRPALFPRLGYADLQQHPISPQSGVEPTNPGSLSFEALLHMYARQPTTKPSSPYQNTPFLPPPSDAHSTTSSSSSSSSGKRRLFTFLIKGERALQGKGSVVNIVLHLYL